MTREAPARPRPTDVGGDLLFDAFPDAVLVVDADDGRVLLANAALTRTTGWSPDAVTGRPIADLLPGLAGAMVGDTSSSSVHALTLADGGTRSVAVTLSTPHHVRGRPVFLVVLRPPADAESDEHVRRLAATNARLRALNRDLEGFTYTVTHDLMEPLRGIEALTGFLRAESGLSREGHEVAERVQANAMNLKRMVRRVLDISRTTQGDDHLADVNVGDAVNAVLQRLTNHLEAQDAHVLVKGLPLPPVRTFPVALDQVLQNLVSNAVKHAPRGVRVVIAVEDAGDAWRFTVDDDGPGVPADKRESIFALFQRGATTAEGAGIGLSTVRSFVTRMGGEVGVCDSADLGGACFWFTVPKEPPVG